ncbi:MAG: hypothetical protein Edafosvirus11_11 [Edafosvirus sp.]|uniref:Uncharacterized protein n=1 Tax=Edafosvirus sp. TaxID=2487765 RepID=A0A3G4ZTY8_9VIRU|nr:MAG: hypothetical protein Edafosvirus11_11 [Edafosvirus sp.]
MSSIDYDELQEAVDRIMKSLHSKDPIEKRINEWIIIKNLATMIVASNEAENMKTIFDSHPRDKLYDSIEREMKEKNKDMIEIILNSIDNEVDTDIDDDKFISVYQKKKDKKEILAKVINEYKNIVEDFNCGNFQKENHYDFIKKNFLKEIMPKKYHKHIN